VHVVLVKENDECSVLGIGDAERFETLIHGDLETVLNAPGFDHDVPPAGARDVVDVAHGGRSYSEGLTSAYGM
jgi:hypothetical protein